MDKSQEGNHQLDDLSTDTIIDTVLLGDPSGLLVMIPYFLYETPE